MVFIEALQRVQKAVRAPFCLHQNEIRTSLQSLMHNQSKLNCELVPGILICIYIFKYNFKINLIKHKFENTEGTTRDIVINCSEIWELFQ